MAEHEDAAIDGPVDGFDSYGRTPAQQRELSYNKQWAIELAVRVVEIQGGDVTFEDIETVADAALLYVHPDK